MSNIDDLSAKVSEAVFRQVEQDRALNRNNIQEAVRKEILAERPDTHVIDQERVSRLVNATSDLIAAVFAEPIPSSYSWSQKIVDAFGAADIAVSEIKRGLR